MTLVAIIPPQKRHLPWHLPQEVEAIQAVCRSIAGLEVGGWGDSVRGISAEQKNTSVGSHPNKEVVDLSWKKCMFCSPVLFLNGFVGQIGRLAYLVINGYLFVN